MSRAPSDIKGYEAAFQELRGAAAQPAWLSGAREQAFAAFAAQGFPTTKTEGWRFTPVETIVKTSFEPAERPRARGGFGGRALCPITFHRIVLHNGRVLPGGEGSALSSLPAGVKVQSLAEVLRDEPEALKTALTHGFDKDGLPFAALAAALFSDGVVVRVARHARLDKPLSVLLVSDDSASGAPQAAHLRVLLLLEEGASAEVVVESVGSGLAPFWTNVLTQAVLGEGATLKHYRLQRESEAGLLTSATLVEAGRAARYESHAFNFGGALVRCDLRVRLAGEGAECALNGLTLTREREIVDQHLVVEHAAVGGTSRVLYKAVLDGKSRFVFDGLAHVRPGAQKTDAHVYNKNLLLSEDADVHTNPEFKILADDVSCKHGGAIGQLSPEALFYLRSRGVGAEQSRRMLVYAFGAEMIARVGLEPLQEALASALMARMPEAAEVGDMSRLDVAKIRADFPILQRRVRGKPLAYLDNAATTQKPRSVIQSLVDFYEEHNANVHRGVHTLSEESTNMVEAVRTKLAKFIGAPKPETVIFTRNATESINLVAYAWGRKFLKAGDEIVITEMEHHSNMVPWQILAKEKGLVLKYVPVELDGTLDMDKVRATLGPKTKLFSFVAVSNALGTVNPVAELVKLGRAVGAAVLVDACQWAPHRAMDVKAWGCDFAAFSAHKMLGPTGIGVLWGREELLEAMDPFLGGGDMISRVTLEGATWNALPYKFEAGTPNFADAVAFGPALDYLSALGLDAVREHEDALAAKAVALLESEPSVRVLGPKDPAKRSGVVSFNIAGLHPHDVGTSFDLEGVAVRVGHHCCQPLMHKLQCGGTARASFYLYNDDSDLEALGRALKRTLDFFKVRPKAGVS